MNPYTNAFESIFTLHTFTKIILLFPKDTQMKSFPSKTSQGRYKIWAHMAWKVIIFMTQLGIHYKQIYMTKKSSKEKNSIKSQLKGTNAQYIHKKRTVKNAHSSSTKISGPKKCKSLLHHFPYTSILRVLLGGFI